MLGIHKLAEEKGPEGTFFNRISQDFYAYWHSLALRRGGVPWKEDLDPAEIVRLLPYIFIVEKQPESGRFFFRLSGTGIRDIMGFENTNHSIDELLEGEDLENVTEMFDQVLSQEVCIRSIEGLTYSDRSYLRVEIIRLPLSKNGAEPSLVVGSLSRIEDSCDPNASRGAVKNKQVIQIENDVLPRRAF